MRELRISSITLRLLPLVILALCRPACSQELDGPKASPEPQRTVSLSSLIAAPGNLLRRTEERGISFHGQFVNDWSKALQGERDAAGGFGRYSLDVSATVDGQKLLGIGGSQAFVRLKNHINEFGSTYDAAAQVYSNIDTQPRTTLYELWYEQYLASRKLRIKGGKIDSNSEFAVVQTAGDFLNSSMGFSPTILLFPTYPEPQPGLTAFVDPATDYRVSVGVFQTGEQVPLFLLEPGHKWTLGETEHPGRLALGYWRLQGKIDRFDGGSEPSAQGYYSVLEQSIWRRAITQGEAGREMSVFIQFGYADGRVSAFTHHLGGGIAMQGLFQRRNRDSLGLAATWVRISPQQAGSKGPAESVVEAYYKLAVTKQVAVIQDFQFLHNPGGLPSNPDCAVITPRLVVAF